MKEVELKNGHNQDGLVRFIHLKSDGRFFKLTWESPVKKAWLVMVDECVLRIDYTREDGSCEECCFPIGFDRNEFLKCKNWDRKQVDVIDGGLFYSF